MQKLQFIKKYNFLFIVPFLYSVQFSIYGEENLQLQKEIKLSIEYFKKGNYSRSREIAEKILYSRKYIPQKILVVLVLTSKDIDTAEKYIQSYYKVSNKIDKELSKSILFFLERCLVSEKYKFGLKWGGVFKKEANSFPEYPIGLYYYSCILKELGKNRESLYVSNLSLSHSTSKILDEKIHLLRLHVLPDKHLLKEIQKFIEKFPNSEYTTQVNGLMESHKKKISDNYVMR
ncbi:MAG: hypothetical protein L6Q54_01755 [Leptospiraceae bacterium]|nr:hypothetical protein [Leptospiraceae bacterium]MCK6379964.1 hypothetical protein [Leptospiraceae bacterium]NUM40075.1 hypothetical protein [Leptospiraceae bacterium]